MRKKSPAKFLLAESEPTGSFFFFQLNFHKAKCIVNCSYNPNRHDISMHLEILRNILDLNSTNYENIIFLGNFNVDIKSTFIKTFYELY